MKKIIWSMVVLFQLQLFFFCLPASAIDKDGPRIVIKEPVFDLLEINEGNDIEHSFKVSNPGNKPLEIEKVQPG